MLEKGQTKQNKTSKQQCNQTMQKTDKQTTKQTKQQTNQQAIRVVGSDRTINLRGD
jgi:hypothetical protein